MLGFVSKLSTQVLRGVLQALALLHGSLSLLLVVRHILLQLPDL